MVNIYRNANGTFTPGNDNFKSGELWLSLAAVPVDGVTATSYNLQTGTKPGSAFGYLNVVGGTAAALFDSNSIALGGGTFADFSWQLTYDTLGVPQGFISAGSINLKTSVVPLPASAWLLASAFLGLIALGVRRA